MLPQRVVMLEDPLRSHLIEGQLVNEMWLHSQIMTRVLPWMGVIPMDAIVDTGARRVMIGAEIVDLMGLTAEDLEPRESCA